MAKESEPPVEELEEPEPVFIPDLPIREVTRPDGWTLFSSVDDRVQRGLDADEWPYKLRCAPWLYQPEGSPLIDDVRHRGAVAFDAGTNYELALFALFQSAGLVGRIPTELAERELLGIGVQLAASGQFIAEEELGDLLPKEIVYRQPVREAKVLLNLTAPFGFNPVSGHIYHPSYELPSWLGFEESAQMIDYAELTSRLLPLLGSLNVLRPHPSQVTS